MPDGFYEENEEEGMGLCKTAVELWSGDESLRIHGKMRRLRKNRDSKRLYEKVKRASTKSSH